MRVEGVGFRVHGVGCRVWGLGFKPGAPVAGPGAPAGAWFPCKAEWSTPGFRVHGAP